MKVKFYNFNKKRNSTKAPSATEGAEMECTIIEPFDVLNPQLKVTFEQSYNYCWINRFSRYYFVTGAICSHGYKVLTLSCDVMASYRSNIFNTSAYVTRCADSRRYNNNLNDNLYPTEAITQSKVEIGSAPYNELSAQVTYIMQADGADGLKTYWLTPTQFSHVVDALWQSWGDVSTDTNSFVKLMGNPTDNIKSIRKCALPMSIYTSLPGTYVTVGNMKNISLALDVTGRNLNRSIDVTIPKPNGYADRPSILYNARYTIWIPGVGFTELPANKLYDAEKIHVNIECAMDTGKSLAELTIGSVKIAEITGTFTTDYGVSFQNVNLPGALSAGLSTAGGIMTLAGTGNPLGVASGIISGLTSLIPSFSSTGSVGDWFNMSEGIRVICTYQNPAGEDITNRGRPCCKVLTLGNCSGYVLCENPHFDGARYPGENDTVNSFLSGGCYIE